MAVSLRKVRSLPRRLRKAVRYELIAHSRRRPIRTDTVLYESFSGNGMLCNPEAVFQGLLAAPDMQHLKHVWVLDDLTANRRTVERYASDPRVRFVEYESTGYYAALATAKYLVNNSTFPPEFGKREGQVYLNTWHGTPLKAMGYDIPGGALVTRNIVRNFVNADYLWAANEDVAAMYLNAYRLGNIYGGAVVTGGSPRVDHQFVTAEQRQAVLEELRGRGVQLAGDEKVLLYAPTWRGDFYDPVNDIPELAARVRLLQAKVAATGHRVLLKVHQQVYKYAAADRTLRPLLVPNDVATNRVLGATDVLITDYSSIFVDFLATGRPVLFLTPDLQEYHETRGLYLAPEDWPGPVRATVDELADDVNALGTGTPADPVVAYRERYAKAVARYCVQEDGSATERVIDVVFRGRETGVDVRRDFADGRPKLLVYLGGLLGNGITTSALNMLANIDHDKVDVSVCFQNPRSEDRIALAASIDPRVRLFPRLGGINGPRLAVRAVLRHERGLPGGSHAADVTRYRDMLRAEFRRMFGSTHFDYIVDFSGYGPLWNKILLQGGAKSYSIFQHNDLGADAGLHAGKSTKSSKHRGNLLGVFDLYRYADHLVSVSPALAEVNRRVLAEFAPPEKFTYARNTINYQRILHLAYGITGDDDRLYAPDARARISHLEDAADDDEGAAEAIDVTNLPAATDRLLAHHSMTEIQDEVERRAAMARLASPPGTTTFVTVGRLSPEKNQARLIRAFDRLHKENPNVRLVILGDGVLEDELRALVHELGLGDAVVMPGFLTNPYAVMAKCDCFVLSSDYEGQPMVLLEALVLGLPVVTTEFGSVRGALPEGYGEIVPRTVEDLADGMRRFLRGEVKSAAFDYVAYNREAIGEFYRAIGLTI
jgi:CDP-glycerol glycerophosphotransferase (TagB/SpsB family)/glycosyltransferase involved in cell wall biosynthesis